ncbi:hypothetical protein [Euzebya sp.]|uniref:hypothetical protein n=1 Tax=Euzebya sp. TaxID=1971409 RepID=UPI003512E2D6
MHDMTDWWVAAVGRLEGDGGFSTAELLANAALAVAALVVVWGGLQGLGVDVVEWIRGQLALG